MLVSVLRYPPELAVALGVQNFDFAGILRVLFGATH